MADSGGGALQTVKEMLGLAGRKRPVPGFLFRIKNLLKYHFRGILGNLIPLVCIYFGSPFNKQGNLRFMWLMMFWYFLLRPVPVPVTGIIPIFGLPLLGVMDTGKTCMCYLSEDIFLMLLGGALSLLLNNSGLDRRIALSIICCGDVNKFSEARIIFKYGMTSYFLSIFSNRLITTSMLTEYYSQASNATESRYYNEAKSVKKVRHIVNNVIQTSSVIGSTAILHQSSCNLAARAIFNESAPPKTELPDLLNYQVFSAIAFPLSLAMCLLNILYHIILVLAFKSKLSTGSRADFRNRLLNNKAQLPKKISLHEWVSLILLLMAYASFFSRWGCSGGWTKYKLFPSGKSPIVRESTIAAVYVFVAHLLPNKLNFVKYLTAKKRKDLPPRKVESAILWWSFVDKNLNYGFFFVLGAGGALMQASEASGLCGGISEGKWGTFVTKQPWLIATLMLILFTSLVSNFLSGTAAVVTFLPLFICMGSRAAVPWPTRAHIVALLVGMSSNYAFCVPFLFTPTYYTYHIGKTPFKSLVLYSIGTWIICVIVLWMGIVYYSGEIFCDAVAPVVEEILGGGGGGEPAPP